MSLLCSLSPSKLTLFLLTLFLISMDPSHLSVGKRETPRRESSEGEPAGAISSLVEREQGVQGCLHRLSVVGGRGENGAVERVERDLAEMERQCVMEWKYER